MMYISTRYLVFVHVIAAIGWTLFAFQRGNVALMLGR